MVHVFLLGVLLGAQQQEQSPQTVSPLDAKPAQTALIPAPTDDAMRIVVDLKKQRVIALEGEKQIYNFHCSTGRNDRTPAGDFSVRQKARYNKALPKYGSVPIPYSLRLDIVKNGKRHLIAIHAFKSVPRYPASHGCIRLKYGDAKKLFEWAEVGIPVIITKNAEEVLATTEPKG